MRPYWTISCRQVVPSQEITGKLPGYLSPSAGLKFEDVPNGLAAISKVPAAGWGQILAYMAFCETSQDQSPGTAAAAGDFGFKVLTSSDPAEKTKKLAAEIANGRLAMMAIIGMFFQVTGPSTPPPRCARSRTSSACRRRLASSTRPASPRMATPRTSRAAARPRSSTAASRCLLPWVTLRLRLSGSWKLPGRFVYGFQL